MTQLMLQCLYIDVFTHPMFIEHPLCARHWAQQENCQGD